MAISLRTPRLLLREWRDEDAEAFAAMSADPALTEFLLPPDDDWVARVRRHWEEHGFGQFVVEFVDSGAPQCGLGRTCPDCCLNRIIKESRRGEQLAAILFTRR